jgi:hypothetical protein
MSTETLEAPQGLPEGEPVAQPDQTDPSTGTDQTAEEATTADSEAQAETAEAEKPAEETAEESPKKTPWFVERIARQREQLAQERQQREELAARLAAFEANQQQQDPNAPVRPPTAEQLQQMVRVEAARIAEQTAMQEKLRSFDSAGRKEFGDKEFIERCNTLASLGASENPAFMQVVTELEDGPRVVAHLADDPEKAMQVLSLPPLRMAAALARLSGQAPKPPPVSKAPPPVRPVNGASRSEGDPDKMSTDQWMKWAEKHLPLR